MFLISATMFVPALSSQDPAVAASFPLSFRLLLWSPETGLCLNPTQPVALDVTQRRHSPSPLVIWYSSPKVLLKCMGAPSSTHSHLYNANPHHGFRRFLRCLPGQRRVPKLCHNDVVRSRSLVKRSQTGMHTLRTSEKFQSVATPLNALLKYQNPLGPSGDWVLLPYWWNGAEANSTPRSWCPQGWY